MKNQLREALGKGLEDLGIEDILANIQQVKADDADYSELYLQQINVEMIEPNPYQPRKTFKEESLHQLAESIKAQGVIQPIVLRKITDGAYQLIAGERRWRAAKLANLATVPAVVRHLTDKAALGVAIIENIQRDSLNAIEQAKSLQQLNEQFEMTHAEIGLLVSKSRATVTNLIRLLQLPDAVKAALADGKIEMGHARCLLGLQPDQQGALMQMIIDKGFSVRATEALVQTLKASPEVAPPPAKQQVLNEQIAQLSTLISNAFGFKVQLKPKRHGGGSVTFDYQSIDELNALLGRMET